MPDGVTPGKLAALYFALMVRRVEENWQDFQIVLDRIAGGQPIADPVGLLKTEALYAALAVGMIGLPEGMPQEQRWQLQSALLDYLERFRSVHPIEAIGSYNAAWKDRHESAGNAEGVGRVYLVRIRDVLPQAGSAPSHIAHLVGSACLLCSVGAWSSILDAYPLET